MNALVDPPAMWLDLAAVTNRGLVREENQDVALADGWASAVETPAYRAGLSLDRTVSCAVIDGMGGHAGGAVAAWLTTRELARGLPLMTNAGSADALAQQAHEVVTDAGEGLGTPRMGAAFAALVLGPAGFQVANVGDCRVYRVAEGALGLLTVDDIGRNHLGHEVLTQAIGGGGHYRVDAHWFSSPWSQGASQRFLLASDGLGVVDDSVIAGVAQRGDVASAASDLVEAARSAGAPDNVTVVVVDVFPVPGIESEAEIRHG